MDWVLVAAGGAIVLLALSDLFSTTLSVASVNGVVSGRIADVFWRQALRLRLSHRRLRTVGLFIVVGLVCGWALTLWVGWSLVFIGASDAVVNSSSGAPVGIGDRLFFAGYLISTLGNGDITATGTGWQVVTVLSSLSGLMAVTLSITFLVPVASGVVQRRQVAATIATLGETPEQLLERTFDGTGFASLSRPLDLLVGELQQLTQRHMAYPVLHYFHSNERHAALAPMVAVLDESLLLLQHGTPESGVDHVTVRSTRDTIAELLRLLENAFVRPADDPPARPELALLKRFDVPVVDASAFDDVHDKETERRRVLRGFVEADGWSWDEVVTAPAERAHELGWKTKR